MTEQQFDPDCRDGKHQACVGGPCECVCHQPVDIAAVTRALRDESADIEARLAGDPPLRQRYAALLMEHRRAGGKCSCGYLLDSEWPSQDHATHVAGVLAGARDTEIEQLRQRAVTADSQSLRERYADAVAPYVRPREWALEVADAVMAVRDTEIERLRAERDDAHKTIRAFVGDPVPASAADRDAVMVETPEQWARLFAAEPWHRQVIIAGNAMDAADRSEAAEAKLARVAELVEYWRRHEYNVTKIAQVETVLAGGEVPWPDPNQPKPCAADMVGIAPDWTRGACTGCYVRWQRRDPGGVTHPQCRAALGIGSAPETATERRESDDHAPTGGDRGRVGEPSGVEDPCAGCGCGVVDHHKLRCERCGECNGWTCPNHGQLFCGCTYLGGPAPTDGSAEAATGDQFIAEYYNPGLVSGPDD